jgi:hypothetical protein
LTGPEPHPDLPDLNFDSGAIKLNYWSTVRQPYTYEDRVANAARIVAYLHPKSILLIDDLQSTDSTTRSNNPVWCTYAHAARAAFIIAQNGTIVSAMPWFRQELLSGFE